MADAGERVAERLQHGELVDIREDDLIVRVGDDVREVLARKPHVEGVEHPSGARRGDVALQMSAVVPGQGGDPGAARQLERVQSVHELVSASEYLGVRRTHHAAGLGADDLDLPVVAYGVLE